MKKLKSVLALLLAAVLALSGCGGGDSATTKADDSATTAAPSGGEQSTTSAPTTTAPADKGVSDETLTVAVMSDPGHFRYDNLTDYSQPMVNLCAMSLMAYNKDLQYENVLIEDAVVDDDGLGITVTLKDGLVFTNGEPVTAEDLAWSMSLFFTASQNTTYDYIDIPTCKAVDDKSAHVDFKTQCGVWISNFQGIRIFSKKAYDATTDDQFWLDPIGVGPYKLTEWIIGDSLTYERTDTYFGETPYFKYVKFRVIPETSVATMELEAGGVDLVVTSSSEEAKIARNSGNPRVVVEEMPGTTIHYFGMNMTHEKFRDLRVRQAFAHAIDKDLLIEGAADGAAVRNDSCIGPNQVGWSDQFSGADKWPYEYNPEKAKALLAEAGFPDGMKVKLLVDGTAIRKAMAEQLVGMMGEAGIELELDSRDFAGATDILNNHPNDYECYLRGGGSSAGDGVSILLTIPVYGLTHFEYTDTYDDYVAENTAIKQELDINKRVEMYKELQAHFVEDWLYWVPTIIPTMFWLHSSDVGGLWKVAGMEYHIHEAYRIK